MPATNSPTSKHPKSAIQSADDIEIVSVQQVPGPNGEPYVCVTARGHEEAERERRGLAYLAFEDALDRLRLEHSLTREQAQGVMLAGLLRHPLPNERERDPRAQLNVNDDLSWQGPNWEATEPMVRRLLCYMHGRDQAMIGEVYEEVWGKTYSPNCLNSIYTAITKANHFLAKRKYPYSLAKVRSEPIIRWQ